MRGRRRRPRQRRGLRPALRRRWLLRRADGAARRPDRQARRRAAARQGLCAATSPTRPRSRRRSPRCAPISATSTFSSSTPARASGAMIEEVKAGGSRALVADQYARPLPDRPAGDPGDAPERAGSDHRRRRDRHRAAARPGRRRSRRPRWRSTRSPNRWPAISGRLESTLRSSSSTAWFGGPVTRSRFTDRPDDFFIEPSGVADDRRRSGQAGPLRLELRGRSAPVQGEMVSRPKLTPPPTTSAALALPCEGRTPRKAQPDRSRSCPPASRTIAPHG